MIWDKVSVLFHNSITSFVFGTIVGIVLKEITVDRLFQYLHKNRCKQTIIGHGIPEIWVHTLRTNQDILLYKKKFRDCKKIFTGEVSSFGPENNDSLSLILTEIKFTNVTVSNGNCRFIFISKETNCSSEIKRFRDVKKNWISNQCPDFAYIKNTEHFALLLNAYSSLSEIILEHNGHQLIYEILERDGSIIPNIK